MYSKKIVYLILVSLLASNVARAGIWFSKSNGVTLTGADGVTLTGADGVTLTGADGFLPYSSNGITLIDANGVTLTGADGVTLTGADGATYTGGNGVTLTGADGVTLTGADGVTLTGADGVTLTGADGTTYRANSIHVVRPNGVTLTGADGVTLTGADGVTLTGADGVTLTGADGVTLTGADGVTLTGADSIIGVGPDGVVFSIMFPQGVTLTGADGVTLTGADGISITGGQGIEMTGFNNLPTGSSQIGIESIDPELAILLNQIADDSNVNAIVSYHNLPTDNDITDLQQLGILGGTRFKALPMIALTVTKQQLVAVSRLSNVKSIYGNRTLTLNADPFFNNTAVQKVPLDRDLQNRNAGIPVSGRNVTVAVLDTGVNALHSDLSGRVIQNVRLADTQSVPVGFANPVPVEGLSNTDPVGGHGTFVSGVIAASGISSGGKYNGVAPGSKILGLSAGDLNLSSILSGFDYILDRGANYNVRVVNCSFSANTVYDANDPVNIATKLLTDRGVNVVVSAGNTGSGNGTLNPYAAAPWVVSVGATNEKNKLAEFSSRGTFGSATQHPTLVATGVNVVSLRSTGTQTGILGVGSDVANQRLTPGELPFYTTASGTSFSAPQVAGAIALMLEANPNLTPVEVKDILQRTATSLPANYFHEVGVGALNTHAAVLEAAFPERKMGLHRANSGQQRIEFRSSTRSFAGTSYSGTSDLNEFSIPEGTIQAGIQISWGIGPNDLNLKLYDAQSNLVGNSNNLNLPGLTGAREKIRLNLPASQNYRAVVQHTGGVGTAQNYLGAVEITQVDYSGIRDLDIMSPNERTVVKESLRNFLVVQRGSKFNPNFVVSRLDLADSLLRSGRVIQYLAGNPQFPDVRNLSARIAAESVQTDQMFFDTTVGSNFRPHNSATKLLTAIALVKAAGLNSQATSAILPNTVSDANSIPNQYRGFVAVALQNGFISLDGNQFNPNRSLNRLELATGMVNLVRFVNQ